MHLWRRTAIFVLSIILIIGIVPISAADEADVPSVWAMDEVSCALALGFVPEELQADYRAGITRNEFAKLALNFIAFQYHYDEPSRTTDFLKRIPYASVLPEQRGKVTVSPSYGQTTYGFVRQLRTYFAEEHGGSDLSAFLTLSRTYQIHENPDEWETPMFGDMPESPAAALWSYALGVVNGRGDATFDPDGLITRQEAAAMLWRAYRVYGGDTALAGTEASGYSDEEQIALWAAEQAALLRVWGVMNGVEGGRFDPLGHYTREQSIATFVRLYQNAPVSRAAGNVPPLVSAEMDAALMIDTQELVDVYSRRENDLAIIVCAKTQPATREQPHSIYIYHRTGGFTKLKLPESHYPRYFDIIDNKTTLRFIVHDFGPMPPENVTYELDLRTMELTSSPPEPYSFSLSTYTQTFLTDGVNTVVPDMRFLDIPEAFRDTLVLLDDTILYPEWTLAADEVRGKLYANDDLEIQTVYFDASLAGKYSDAGTEYVWSVSVKSNVFYNYKYVHLGDPSSVWWSLKENGRHFYAGRPGMEIMTENGFVTRMEAISGGDVDAMKYKVFSINELRPIYP